MNLPKELVPESWLRSPLMINPLKIDEVRDVLARLPLHFDVAFSIAFCDRGVPERWDADFDAAVKTIFGASCRWFAVAQVDVDNRRYFHGQIATEKGNGANLLDTIDATVAVIRQLTKAVPTWIGIRSMTSALTLPEYSLPWPIGDANYVMLRHLRLNALANFAPPSIPVDIFHLPQPDLSYEDRLIAVEEHPLCAIDRELWNAQHEQLDRLVENDRVVKKYVAAQQILASHQYRSA